MSELIEFPLDAETRSRLLCNQVVAEGTALLAKLRESRAAFYEASRAQNEFPDTPLKFEP